MINHAYCVKKKTMLQATFFFLRFRWGLFISYATCLHRLYTDLTCIIKQFGLHVVAAGLNLAFSLFRFSNLGIQTAQFKQSLIVNKPYSSEIPPTLMGNGIASWPSNSLLIPATTSVITITLSLSSALWEKHCWQKDLQITMILGTACCTQHSAKHIWPQYASYFPYSCNCLKCF